MNAQEIAKFLDAIGAKPGVPQGPWIHAPCPLAPWEHEGGTDSDPSFGIKIGPGDSRVHCFSCDFSGTAGDVVMQLHRHGAQINFAAALGVVAAAVEESPVELTTGEYEAEMFASREPPHIYPEELLGATEPAYYRHDPEGAFGGLGWARHPYLVERRVTPEVAVKLDLRWDPYRYRIVFPVRDFEGRLRGLHGRHVPDEPFAPEPRVAYKMYPHEGQTNPHIWLGEHWLDAEQPLLIAESVFDLCRCLELYPNTVSPLTASIRSHRIQRLLGVDRVVTVFDADKAGDKARKRLRQALPDATVHDVILDHGRDAADYATAELAEKLWMLELNGG